ncbi:MAG: MarR family transcriptional regulator, partial [Leptolyngbya sp. SIO3F4]|nr:MarR family transcriptional regulator [Leptolyngbya sp. SIO3F4]
AKIREALGQSLQDWQANPEFENNSLVVLGRPVEDIAPILKASLDGAFPDCEVRFFLGGYQRPSDPLTVPQHLKRELESKKDDGSSEISTPVTQTDRDNHVPTIMVVSSLEQCFLRCIQGWEGIEYLQTLSTRDPSQFWVFGCNHWAWVFLERVCQVSAYLENAIALPELSGSDLKAWLTPLVDTWLDTQETGPMVQVAAASDSYWNSLANVADGIASTALQVWLKSLQIRTEALSDDRAVLAELPMVELLPTKPALPGLITLEAMDRYLLHSLLIHREMTRSHLAISLGEAERNIRSRLQVLRREGIIRQRGRRFSVDPAYYPKLYSELGNNNFLIGKA